MGAYGALEAYVNESPSAQALLQRFWRNLALSIGDPHWRSIGEQEVAVRDNGFAARQAGSYDHFVGGRPRHFHWPDESDIVFHHINIGAGRADLDGRRR